MVYCHNQELLDQTKQSALKIVLSPWMKQIPWTTLAINLAFALLVNWGTCIAKYDKPANKFSDNIKFDRDKI